MLPASSATPGVELALNLGRWPWRFAPPAAQFAPVYAVVLRTIARTAAQAAGEGAGKLFSRAAPGCWGTFPSMDGGAESPRVLSAVHGLPSAALQGVALATGRWYYEVRTIQPGCGPVGWGDLAWVQERKAGRGTGRHSGVGDDKHSWGFDGGRINCDCGLLWHGYAPHLGEFFFILARFSCFSLFPLHL